MFGTIGHAQVKAGHIDQLNALLLDWKVTIRPQVPGAFLEVSGHRAGAPDQMVFLALAQDEATYRKLADMPEQDAFFRKMLEHLEGEPIWEDVDMEITVSE